MSCSQQIVTKKISHTHTVKDITDFNQKVGDLLVNYLPLSGGALTGDLSATNIFLNNESLTDLKIINYDSNYDTVNTLSAAWNMGGGGDNDTTTIVQNYSANWNDVVTIVTNNSASNWNYQGTDVKELTSTWQNTFTNFSVQSANNLSVYTNTNSNSANYTSVYTTVNTNSATWASGTGGSGGGKTYYFNQATLAQSPTTNLPITARQLGSLGLSAQTIYTSGIISQVDYTLVTGFVTDVLNPNTTSIPGGIWDFNIWGYSDATANNPTVLQAVVYTYDGINAPVLLSTSDDEILTNNGIFIPGSMSCLVPQKTISLSDRIYVEIRAKATTNNKTVTLAFGDSTPSHIHTTLPFVGGTGLMKIVNGVTQTPASLLVDADVASAANIDRSKINGLTTVVDNVNSSYTTLNTQSANNVSNYTIVNSNSANWNSNYTIVNSNSALWILSGIDVEIDPVFTSWAQSYSSNYQDTYVTVNQNSSFNWNYQGTDIKSLTSDFTNAFNTVQTNSAINWNYQGNDIRSLTGNWESVYSSTNSNSGDWNNSYNVIKSQSANNLSLYSNVNANSATIWNYQGNDVRSLTSDYQNTTNTVQLNSAVNWNYQGTDIKVLTATWQNTTNVVLTNSDNWQEVYSTVNSNSAIWQEVYSTVNSNSAIWILSGGSGVAETDPLFTSWAQSNSANYQGTLVTVQANSAINWNYQGTDVKELTGNYSSNYTTVQNNSANWNSVYSNTNNNSALFIDTRNTVQSNSSLWLLSGLSVETDPIYTSWANTYSANLYNSSLTVQSNSALNWNYQGTDIKSLTSNWQNTYVNFSTQSANNINLLTVVQTNSAQWAIDTSAETTIQSLTANWQNTYTTVNITSATWTSSNTPQTINFNPTNTQLSISDGNTIALSALRSNLQEVWIGAGAMVPTTLSGASFTTLPLTATGNAIYLDACSFDPASIQYAQFNIILPTNSDKRNIKMKFSWTCATSSVSGNVVWGIQSTSIDDNDLLDKAWGISQEITDSLSANGTYQLSNATAVISPSGNISDNSMLLFRIYRNASSINDTLAINAALLGVKIQYPLNNPLSAIW